VSASELNWQAQVVGDDPDQQVSDTIRLMSRYSYEDAGSPEVKAALAEAEALAEDPVEGIFWFVKRLIRFQRDEVTALPLASSLARYGLEGFPVVEVLIRPRDILTWRNDTGQPQVGDCDDYAMLTASMLRARGIPASFVTVAADPSVPDQFSHVYVAAYPGGKRVALDTSHGAYPGWEVEAGRREEWPIDAGLQGIALVGLIVLALVAAWARRRVS